MKLSAHHDFIVQCAAAGLTRQEIAANVGASVCALYHYCRAHRIKVVHASRVKHAAPNDRAIEMRDAYVSGQTPEEVSQVYGISRERVRQIITKHFGCLSKVGGISKRAAMRHSDVVAAREEQCLREYGLTMSEYIKMRRYGRRLVAQGVSYNRTPLGAYHLQMGNAKRRGIAWDFNFATWWRVWQRSGKWDRRGRTATSFVMCRHGDTGPYSPGNVYIAPAFENTSDGTRKNDLPIGVYATYNGKFISRITKGGKKYHLGTFTTPSEAHKAYLGRLSGAGAAP